MKLYDLLSSTDTKPMDRIRRNIPQWQNSFLMIPSSEYGQLYCVNASTNQIYGYAFTIADLLATDWVKF